jgi:23S rRNA (guanine2445-N2)-methyltransferase / 23S rRNA (guanine2069-N7)-methyltransferase
VNQVPSLYMATAPRGLADLVARELRQLGITQLRERTAGVLFRGTLAQGYRACLYSRVASRVLLQVAEFSAATTEAFHAAVRALDWRVHVDPAKTLACEFTGSHPTITHSHFGALKLKDGICDQLRAATGARPDVELERPAVKVVAHAHGAQIGLYLDLAGEGLHRRGYRQRGGEAPLRENLAAGVLLRAGWPGIAAAGGGFLDPMCGSGTLPIEAAMIAADMAPGLQRDYWGFLGWRGHESALWCSILDEARARVRAQLPVSIRGSDQDAAVLRNALLNAQRAGVEGLVRFACLPVSAVRPDAPTGLMCTNPPYGARLGDAELAREAHRQLGATLREHFSGWQAAVLTASPEGARELSLRSVRTHELWNGALACRLLRFDLARPGAPARAEGERAAPDPQLVASPGAQMFANRIAKNLRLLSRKARQEQVDCYRLYDADMPEYAFAIDRYLAIENGAVHLYVQEYAAPESVDASAVQRRRAAALAALPGATGVEPGNIHLRTRQRQRGASQYTRMAREQKYLLVEEDGLKLNVNFSDYLDTGLFLDHRLVRRRIRAAAAGQRFLNLFCYTASATVHAAAGGAARSLSIDMSATYLAWAARNFSVNGLERERHELLQADCLQWLREARLANWDLILLDPPTFSNSKRMSGVLDTQRDHAAIIGECMRLLAPGGLLIFSTNAQRFRLDEAVTERWEVADTSAATIPFDFKRNERIHRCFELRARAARGSDQPAEATCAR